MNRLKKLGEILIDLGYISKEHIELGLKFQKIHKRSEGEAKLGEFLLSQRCITEEHLKEALDIQNQMVKLQKQTRNDQAEGRLIMVNDPELFTLISLDVARKYHFFPLAMRDDPVRRTLFIACDDNKQTYIEELQFALGCFITVIPASKSKIDEYLKRYDTSKETKKKTLIGTLALFAKKKTKDRT